MNSNQSKKLRQLAHSRGYGWGVEHAEQVMRLSLKTYSELCRLKLLISCGNDVAILESSALLHDVGRPGEPHNEAGFDFLADRVPKVLADDPLTPEELSTILYCVLWHTNHNHKFTKRNDIEIAEPPYTRRIASIVRVADALDRSLRRVVSDVSLDLKRRTLTFLVSSKGPASIEITRAEEKADLMRQAFELDEIRFKPAGTMVTI